MINYDDALPTQLGICLFSITFWYLSFVSRNEKEEKALPKFFSSGFGSISIERLLHRDKLKLAYFGIPSSPHYTVTMVKRIKETK